MTQAFLSLNRSQSRLFWITYVMAFLHDTMLDQSATFLLVCLCLFSWCDGRTELEIKELTDSQAGADNVIYTDRSVK